MPRETPPTPQQDHRAEGLSRRASGRVEHDAESAALEAELGAVDLGPVLEAVQHTWGFDGLRPLQAPAIRAALAGRDALVVLPTGGGKSLCYQAPALVREGLTVVVSPLISLMKDQLDGLTAHGVPAAMLASVQDEEERREVRAALRRGEPRLLFVSPERLVLDGFLAELVELGLTGLAIDEAHCISHWGHDFRPEYRQLGELRRQLPWLSVQAFTATATPRVRADIVEQLQLVDPLVLVGDFDRPNLTYRVLPRGGLLEQVLEVVQRHPGQGGIVYCLRRTDVEKLAGDLARRGVRCQPYHAGLDADRRRAAQEAFLREEIEVVVATVAFGMGIDRPDVRFVVHASLPKGVEQYSQETGRAGRDGLPAECVLYYGGSDFHGWRNLMERGAQEAQAAGHEDAGADLDGALERLGQMWNLATGATCRHAALLEYFGQSSRHGPEGCGACDVCLGELEEIPDALVVAQKILSCVVHCEQRYGAGHVTDVLRGARTARLRQTGHDGVSTYGLLAERSARAIRAWIEQLCGLGHLLVAPGPYPTLYLSRSGLELMRGEREVRLFLPREPTAAGRRAARARSAAPPDLEAEGLRPDPELFEHLRATRRRLARERGVPPYIVFNDRTLARIAAQRPTTVEEFRGLKGVGDKKASDLGPLFLEAIAAHARGEGPDTASAGA